VLSELVVALGDEEPVALHADEPGGSTCTFVGIARALGDRQPDPDVVVQRDRTVTPDGLTETITVRSHARRRVSTILAVTLAVDGMALEQLKRGQPASPPIAPTADGAGSVTWQCQDRSVRVSTTPAPAQAEVAQQRVRLAWQVELGHQDAVTVTVQVQVTSQLPPLFVAADPPWTEDPVVEADDPRLALLLDRGLRDLRSLMLANPGGDDRFLAAGVPWFLTLFGRDALWAARMLLPLGTELALGTLRVLASRQGRVHDAATDEEPGRILHEVRRPGLATLPPVYYGTIDATPLWLCLWVDAWRWGAPLAALADLVPAAQECLGWLEAHGSRDDGFVAYVDSSGKGLANQGWKDSGDSIQWADGRLAQPPLALCEVQGYAVEAALGAADLMDALDLPVADRWRSWATALTHRFRDRFWVEGPHGRYPAVALDAAGRPVDSLTSNIGHLLGTGLLDVSEERAVAAHLRSDALASGFGLRTLASSSGGYSPLSYHAGSVWPHDTAITVACAVRAGHGDAAAALVEGLLAAGAGLRGCLPELFSGAAPRAGSTAPVPYPASCRPQAWSAAVGVSLLTSLLGLAPDVPAGRVALRPMRPSPVGRWEVSGMRVGSGTVSATVDRTGAVTASAVPASLVVKPLAPRGAE